MKNPSDQKHRTLYKRRRIAQISRVGLPILAVLLLGSAFLLSPNDLQDTLSLPLERERVLSDGLKVLSPTFQGTMTSGEVYKVRAEWALPSGSSMVDVSEVALHKMEGTLELKTGETVYLRAENALAKTHNKHVILSGVVELETSDGYTLKTQQAVLDGIGSVVQSDVPVLLTTAEGGTLNAGSMTLTRSEEDGDIVAQFKKGVKVVFNPVSKNDLEHHPTGVNRGSIR